MRRRRSIEQGHRPAYAIHTPADIVIGAEAPLRRVIESAWIKICPVCGLGPLAWAQNRNGKWVMAMVYRENGKLVANPAHVHFPKECQEVQDYKAKQQAQGLEPHRREAGLGGGA